MNLWQMFQYGGPIMYILVAMFALAVYLFIERLITLKQASKEDNSFMNRIKDYIYDGKIDAAKKLCHDTNTPTARMVEKGISRLGRPMSDVLVAIENVGNLVCPAETDTGASRNVVILSYPEGDDKPLKYPLMFEVCHVVLINKIDTKEYFDFDDKAVVERIHERNPLAKVFFVSAKTGEGFEEWISWLDNNIKEWIGGTV
jgi:hydrogenase accessory protein HypB